MSRTASARTRTRRARRPAAAGLVVVTAAIVGALAYQSASSAPSVVAAHLPGAHRGALGSASSSAPSFIEIPRGDHRGAATEHDGVVTEADGVLPDGVTVFDDRYPGIANLDPDLLQALRVAATEAADDGIEFSVHSAWRSPDYQEQLFREAVSTYGSESEAARWVATPETSTHVSGDAIDIGPDDARVWLSEHGADYGLCPTYRNEPWHYELRPLAIDRGCPPMYADAAHDPRMQR